MLANLLVTFTLLMTACAPAATEQPPAPAEEPTSPAEPAATEAPAAPQAPSHCTEDGNNMVCIFGENEDVKVMIPWQPGYGAFLYAVDLGIEKDLDSLKNENRDQIAPDRLVINFEVVLDPNVPEERINDFDPPIELAVRYTEEDVNVVGGVENLQLGFWDEENGYWVSFKRDRYNFRVEGDESGGYIWATISSWGDRYIGMGFGAANFECSVDGDNMVCAIGANDDVIVIAPKQPGYDAYLYAVDLPIGNLEELKSDKDEFKPYRLVINVELVLDPSVPEEHISDFDPPIELGVRYTEEDVKAAGGLGNLQLGFWDEENNYWVSFAQNSKYNFKVDGDELGGYIWVTIFSWGDRYIGYG